MIYRDNYQSPAHGAVTRGVVVMHAADLPVVQRTEDSQRSVPQQQGPEPQREQQSALPATRGHVERARHVPQQTALATQSLSTPSDSAPSSLMDNGLLLGGEGRTGLKQHHNMLTSLSNGITCRSQHTHVHFSSPHLPQQLMHVASYDVQPQAPLQDFMKMGVHTCKKSTLPSMSYACRSWQRFANAKVLDVRYGS